MSRHLRILALVAVLLGIGLRVATVHSHDGAAHPESCALCQILQTPLAAPPAGVTAAVSLLAEPAAPLPVNEAPAAQPPILDGRLLRAPPSI